LILQSIFIESTKDRSSVCGEPLTALQNSRTAEQETLFPSAKWIITKAHSLTENWDYYIRICSDRGLQTLFKFYRHIYKRAQQEK